MTCRGCVARGRDHLNIQPQHGNSVLEVQPWEIISAEGCDSCSQGDYFRRGLYQLQSGILFPPRVVTVTVRDIISAEGCDSYSQGHYFRRGL